MKTKTTKLMILLVFLLNSGFRTESGSGLFTNNPSDIKSNIKFELVRSDDNISVYIRRIPITETTSARQVKAEFVIDSPAENVVSVLRNEKLYTKWMKATKTYYRLKTINDNQWLVYIQFSIPWPLNDQDCILSYEVKAHPELNVTEITLVGKPDYIAPYEGIERISHLEGSWIITQTGIGKTRVEYYMFSKQQPTFPSWMTDPIIQKNLIKTMVNLREIVMNSSK